MGKLFDEILLGSAIVAVTGELKKLFPFVTGIVTVVVACGLGAIYGFLTNGDVIRGGFVGLASSGVLKSGAVIRGN